MSSSAVSPALGIGTAPSGSPARSAVHPGWIHSPFFDLALFTLSPLTGVLLVFAAQAGQWGIYLNVAAVFFVAIPHYLSSFSFYFGDDSFQHYKSRRLAFFAGPVIIVAAVAMMRFTGLNDLLQSFIYTWNVYHVSRQSSGILAMYRRLGGGNSAEKKLADWGLICLNGSLAFWHIDRFPPMYAHVSLGLRPALMMLGPALLVIAAIAWTLFALKLMKREHTVSFPEGAFLLSSVLLFHPYLWVKDLNEATFAMLMGHFIQYLSIVWLLHRRKYAGTSGSMRQQLLGRTSGNVVALGLVIVMSGLAFYAISRGSALIGAYVIYLVLWNALAVVHFYLDGLIWAFKEPFVRQSIGPYLTPDAHRLQF
jgi:hypothetical protein